MRTLPVRTLVFRYTHEPIMPEVALLLTLIAPARHLARANSKGSAGSGAHRTGQKRTKTDTFSRISMANPTKPDKIRQILANLSLEQQLAIDPVIRRSGTLPFGIASCRQPIKSGGRHPNSIPLK